MSTPNDPDDNKADDRGMTMPWQRGEATAATGLTAGDVAKAAGGGVPAIPQISPVDEVRPPSGPSGPRGPGSAAGPGQGGPNPGGPNPGGPGLGGPNPGGPGPGGRGRSVPDPAQTRQTPTVKPPAAAPAAGAHPAGAPAAGSSPAGGVPGGGNAGAATSQLPKAALTGQQPVPGSGQGAPHPGAGPAGPHTGPTQSVASAPPGRAPVPKPTPHGRPAVPPQSQSQPQAQRGVPGGRTEVVTRDEPPNLDKIHHVETATDKNSKDAAQKDSGQTDSGKQEQASRESVRAAPRTMGVPLRAAVQLRRVDPWSVFKISGILSLAGFLIWMIAVAILYGVLEGMGVWDQINSSYGTLVNVEGGTTGDELFTTGAVFSFAAGFGALAAIIFTALSTISAYIYNVCADMVGGIEVTLADLD